MINRHRLVLIISLAGLTLLPQLAFSYDYDGSPSRKFWEPATRVLKRILPERFYKYFGEEEPTGGRSIPRGKPASYDVCVDGKNIGYDHPCYSDANCKQLGTDFFCKVSKQAKDNGTYEGCCEQKATPPCPDGKPPTGGKCEGDKGTGGTGGSAPINPPKIPTGCIGLKVTHQTDNIVKIEYGNFCPFEIDQTYLVAPLLKLNNGTTPLVLLPEVADPTSPEATEWYQLKEALTGVDCAADDPQKCHGFMEYKTAAKLADDGVWTSNSKYPFKDYTFWRVEGLDMKQKQDCVMDPNKGGGLPVDEDCWNLLGFGRMKEFFDDAKGVDGKPTGALTPRFWVPVHVKGQKEDQWFDIQGQVTILAPQITATVNPTPVKPGALKDNQPYWNVRATIHNGTFLHQLTLQDAKGNEIPCPEKTTPNDNKEGFSFSREWDCPISKEITLQGEGTGLNRHDHPIQAVKVNLTNPEVDLKAVKCSGTDPVTNLKITGSCGDFSSTGTAQEAFDPQKPASPNSSGSKGVDLNGFVDLQYTVQGRSPQAASKATVQGSTGSGGLEVTTDAKITVPWVGSVKITPSGGGKTQCKEAAAVVSILKDGKIDGTTTPAKAKLTDGEPKILGKALTGNVGLVKDYTCFKYVLTLFDMDGSEISVVTKPVDFKYQDEFLLAGVDKDFPITVQPITTKNDGNDPCDTASALNLDFWNENWCGYKNYRVEISQPWKGKLIDLTSIQVTCQFMQWNGAPNQKLETVPASSFLVTPPAKGETQGMIKLISPVTIEPWDNLPFFCKVTAKSLLGNSFTKVFQFLDAALNPANIPANPNGIGWTWTAESNEDCGPQDLCGPYCPEDGEQTSAPGATACD